jgi:uncharacterized integral membrane protein
LDILLNQIETAIGAIPSIKLGKTISNIQATANFAILISASRLPASESSERRFELDASSSMSPRRGSIFDLKPASHDPCRFRCCRFAVLALILRYTVYFRICAERHTDMRWIHLTVMVLFLAATALFAVQNFEIVTMSFLGFSARAPMALLVAIVYLLGMVTGGSLLALLRRSFQGSRRTAIE